MSDLEVGIVTLEPMRVAAALGFGPSPEEIAWGKILTWAKGKGLLQDLKAHRFFGFNNPDPTPGSPNYGYEQWITVGPEVQAEGEVEIKDFAGGLYAVHRCRLSEIGEAWRRLVLWHRESRYQRACHQWLEESVRPEVSITPERDFDLPQDKFEQVIMDLYLPIAE